MHSWTKALAVVSVAWLAGCGGSCGMTLGSGRSVTATSDTLNLSATSGQDTAHLKLGSTAVVVEPARVLVNTKQVAVLDPQARNISVTRAGGQLQVTADGQPVYSGKL